VDAVTQGAYSQGGWEKPSQQTGRAAPWESQLPGTSRRSLGLSTEQKSPGPAMLDWSQRSGS